MLTLFTLSSFINTFAFFFSTTYACFDDEQWRRRSERCAGERKGIKTYINAHMRALESCCWRWFDCRLIFFFNFHLCLYVVILSPRLLHLYINSMIDIQIIISVYFFFLHLFLLWFSVIGLGWGLYMWNLHNIERRIKERKQAVCGTDE